MGLMKNSSIGMAVAFQRDLERQPQNCNMNPPDARFKEILRKYGVA